ncbi:hypothetical protein V6Z11_A12G304500 [Gossypium hirsutum]
MLSSSPLKFSQAFSSPVKFPVTGPPPLVAPPPSRFQPDHKDLSTIRPEEPTSTKSTPKIVAVADSW